MDRLNKIPFLETLTLGLLCVVGLVLRLLPGSYPVIFKISKPGSPDGSACFTLTVLRIPRDKLEELSSSSEDEGPHLPTNWEEVPYWPRATDDRLSQALKKKRWRRPRR